MKLQEIIVFAMILLPLSRANAYWPVGINENLAVAAAADTFEGDCHALPLSEDRIIVLFRKGVYGPVFQIFDKFGEPVFPELMSLYPAIQSVMTGSVHAVPDGEGGVIAAWKYFLGINPNYGIRAQKLDSLGNLLWGDEGILISPYMETDFDICADGEGGIFLSVSPDEEDFSDLYAQHIDAEGNLLWQEMGIPVCIIPNEGANHSNLVPDNNGGVYILWRDGREPYTYNALFLQHLDSESNHLWSQDLFIYEAPSGYHDIIPDGEGGCIVYGGSAYDADVWRVNSQGNILWRQEEVTWYVSNRIVSGEPGFFYLGFQYNGVVYGQRMDIDGNFYWPHGAPFYGAEMWDDPNRWLSGGCDWHFYYPYFYTIFGNQRPDTEIHHLTIQVLDTLGNKMLGDFGVDLTILDLGWSQFNDVHAIPSNDGIVGVFHEDDLNDNIWAKRCDWDGTLGGPNAPINDITISVSDNDIVLTWPEMSPSADYYIYKSGEPYAFPPDPFATVENDTVWTDPGAVAEVTGYYDVRWEPSE